jgi:Mce-associated membrane protein
VPSFRRRASVIDADSVGKPPQDPGRAADSAQALALAEAEAEAAEAEATAAAARARARAIRLRRQALAGNGHEPAGTNGVLVETVEPATDETDAASVDTVESDTVDTTPDTDRADADDAEDAEDSEDDVASATEPGRRRRLRVPRPNWKYLAAGLVILVIAALLAASGWMVWQHREAARQQQLTAEFAAAGRQSVVTLMSLDFNKAQDDVNRIIDNSTGSFKDDFQNQAADFVKVAQDSKVITEVTVNATAVESMTDDTATVLVSASSRVTNSAGAKQEPRSWRLSVDLQRDGGQIKMSKVEFVP